MPVTDTTRIDRTQPVVTALRGLLKLLHFLSKLSECIVGILRLNLLPEVSVQQRLQLGRLTAVIASSSDAICIPFHSDDNGRTLDFYLLALALLSNSSRVADRHASALRLHSLSVHGADLLRALLSHLPSGISQ